MQCWVSGCPVQYSVVLYYYLFRKTNWLETFFTQSGIIADWVICQQTKEFFFSFLYCISFQTLRRKKKNTKKKWIKTARRRKGINICNIIEVRKRSMLWFMNFLFRGATSGLLFSCNLFSPVCFPTGVI